MGTEFLPLAHNPRDPLVSPSALLVLRASTAPTAPNRAACFREVATLIAMMVEGSMALKDVKNHLSEVVDQVEREHDRVVITKHGRPSAVVISVDDLESLEETLDIAGRPALIKQIRASLTEIAASEVEVLTKEEILHLRGA